MAVLLDALSVFAQDAKLNVGDEETLEDWCLKIRTMPDDTTKLRLISQIYHNHYNLDSILKYSELATQLAKKLEDQESMAEALMFKGAIYDAMGNNRNAIMTFFEALTVWVSNNNKTKQAVSYNCLAVLLEKNNDYYSAIDYFEKALKLFQETGDNKRTARIYRCLSKTYLDFDLNEISESYANKAISIDEPAGDFTAMAYDVLYLGNSYNSTFQKSKNKADLLKTKEQYYKAYDLSQKSNFLDVIIETTIQLQSCYLELAKISKGDERQNALDSCQILINYGKDCIDKMGNTVRLIDQGFVEFNKLMLNSEFKDAKVKLDSLNSLCKKNVDNYYNLYFEGLSNCYISYYKTNNDYKNILELDKQQTVYRSKKYNLDFLVKASIIDVKMEFEEKIQEYDKERHRLQRQAETEQTIQNIARTFMSVIMVSVVLIIIFVTRNFLAERRNNKKLAAQNADIMRIYNEQKIKNEEITKQNQEIENQRVRIEEQKNEILASNKATIHSIEYASKIQQATMTSKETLKKIFGDILLIYRPLSIVSGDFYWANQAGNYKMMCVADCTGHGIPGGLLSILGISSLNNILQSVPTPNNAAEILNQLRIKVINATTENNYDGMDVALCIIDTSKKIVSYAGAMRPIWILRDGKITEIRADRMPIGRHKYQSVPFANHTFEYKEGDRIYSFSDGMVDIFGQVNINGDTDIVKFGEKRLKATLNEIAGNSFAEQKLLITNRLREWQKNSGKDNLIDDQVMLGIQL